MPAPKNKKPSSLPKTIEWADETVSWFKAWRDSPRTDGWDDVQWQYFFDTAVVHSSVYGFNDVSLLPELSKRLQFMGLSFDRYEKKEEAKVTTIDVIRARRADRVSRAKDKTRAS